MRALVLSDLHYVLGDPASARRLSVIDSISGKFDAVLLCGDNAELSSDDFQNHATLFGNLRKKFDCPMGAVVGNHELWGRKKGVSSSLLIDKVFPAIFRDYKITSLEHENLSVGDTTFVGTYGHFDYSLFKPGNGVTMDDVRLGKFNTGERIIGWEDIESMDWPGRAHEKVCADLVSKFEDRLKSAKGKKISLSHTIPDSSLNSWPDSPKQSFMGAYAGSRLIGDALERNGGVYHFCGHTHSEARADIGRTSVFNIGQDDRKPGIRYIILHDEELALCWSK
ncbi:MAG: metallophosphoesterase [Nanoarchaeota archaeon]